MLFKPVQLFESFGEYLQNQEMKESKQITLRVGLAIDQELTSGAFQKFDRKMRLTIRHRPIIAILLVFSQILVFYLGRLSNSESSEIICPANTSLAQIMIGRPKTYMVILIMSGPSKYYILMIGE